MPETDGLDVPILTPLQCDFLVRLNTAPRRLTPSQPSPLPTGVGAVPESLRQITSRVPDRTRLKLQKAFLDEYSGPGQKARPNDSFSSTLFSRIDLIAESRFC